MEGTEISLNEIKMTFYATSLSDKVIITSDNPRFEDPYDIVEDMLIVL